MQHLPALRRCAARLAGLGLLLLPLGAGANPCEPPGQGGLCAMFWQGISPEEAASVDVDARYVNGLRPLQMAATFAADPAVVGALIDAGAPLDARDDNGNTALISAAKLSDSPASVRRLLEAGADVSAANDEGETALHGAAGATNEPAIIRLLVEAGAPLEAEATNRWAGATPLIYAARWNTNPSVMAALLDAGAATDVRVSGGETALHQACAAGQTPAVARLLVERVGLAVDARDRVGETPLHEAADNDRTARMVELLGELGADLDAQRRKDGWTPLHVAAADGNGRTLQALLDAGADPNVTDDSDRLALDVAEGLEGAPALKALRRATDGARTEAPGTGEAPDAGGSGQRATPDSGDGAAI